MIRRQDFGARQAHVLKQGPQAGERDHQRRAVTITREMSLFYSLHDPVYPRRLAPAIAGGSEKHPPAHMEHRRENRRQDQHCGNVRNEAEHYSMARGRGHRDREESAMLCHRMHHFILQGEQVEQAVTLLSWICHSGRQTRESAVFPAEHCQSD